VFIIIIFELDKHRLIVMPELTSLTSALKWIAEQRCCFVPVRTTVGICKLKKFAYSDTLFCLVAQWNKQYTSDEKQLSIDGSRLSNRKQFTISVKRTTW
jgi:hypothetical protein